jgi:amino acid transporter
MRSALRRKPTNPCAGEFEGRHPASSTGDLGVGTPRSGFYPTKNHRSKYLLEVSNMAVIINRSTSTLRAECLSFREILAQSVANIAPTLTPTVNAALVFASSGNATWLTYTIATLGLVFVSMNINQFAQRSAAPGSLYMYIAQGLGPMAGVITGWALMLAYLFTGIAVANGFVNSAQVLLAPFAIVPSPIFLLAICIGLSWYVAYKDIQLSTVLMLLLEVASVGMIILLGIIVLFKKGYAVDINQLTLHDTKPSSIVSGLVLAVFSFVGFESATTLGTEAKNPLRNIPKAVMYSTVTCGLFFIVLSYIQIIGFTGLATTFDKSTAPINDLANAAGVGFFGTIILFGSMVSFFACTLACINAGARIAFSMAQHGIFHHRLGHAHGTNRTPYIAVTIACAIVFLIPTVTTMFGVKPLDNYAYAGTISTYGFLVAYLLISIAAPLYMARRRELQPSNILVSGLAIIFMLIPTIGSFGIPGKNFLSEIFPIPAAPYNVFPYFFLLYLVLGGVWFAMLRSRSPRIIQQMEADIEDSHNRFGNMRKV